MKRENMTTIRRQLWRYDKDERRERLEAWEADNLANNHRPNKADVKGRK